MPDLSPSTLLNRLFADAVAAVTPERRLPPHLPPPPAGRTVVLGAGKAAAAMAQAVERHWPGELSGLVITRYGHGAATERVEVVEAGHPLPDSAGRAAARRILDEAAATGTDDLVLCLLSGGGSALLTLPAEGAPPARETTAPRRKPASRDRRWRWPAHARYAARKAAPACVRSDIAAA